MAVQSGQEHVDMAVRQAAAEDLAVHLEKFAGTLAAKGFRPRRVPYGPGVFKHRSPKGFLLNVSGPRLLLPDGRLWQYHTRRQDEGIYYDARVDHTRSMHGSIPLGEGRFSFLGAIVGKFHFGYRHNGNGADSPDDWELGAIRHIEGNTEFLSAAEAFGIIADNLDAED